MPIRNHHLIFHWIMRIWRPIINIKKFFGSFIPRTERMLRSFKFLWKFANNGKKQAVIKPIKINACRFRIQHPQKLLDLEKWSQRFAAHLFIYLLITWHVVWMVFVPRRKNFRIRPCSQLWWFFQRHTYCLGVEDLWPEKIKPLNCDGRVRRLAFSDWPRNARSGEVDALRDIAVFLVHQPHWFTPLPQAKAVSGRWWTTKVVTDT